MDPATASLLTKVAVKLGTDKRVQKLILALVIGVVVLIAIPIFLVISIFEGNSQYNDYLIEMSFNNEEITEELSPQDRNHIENYRRIFKEMNIYLDENIFLDQGDEEDEEIKKQRVKIKALFYGINETYRFNVYEVSSEPERENEEESSENSQTSNEIVIVDYENMVVNEEFIQIWIDSFFSEDEFLEDEDIYLNLENEFGITITDEIKEMVNYVYSLVIFGVGIIGDLGEISIDGFISPFGGSYVWENYVSSEFGYRIHPIDGTRKLHSGIDFAFPEGTPIQAVKDGIVIKAVRSNTGYGNQIEVEHENGVVTKYAHCHEIFVKNGDTVTQGQVIATVGTTGKSTGNHLHFEVIINGEKVNPRLVLL